MKTKWYTYMVSSKCVFIIIFKRDLGTKTITNRSTNKKINLIINYLSVLGNLPALDSLGNQQEDTNHANMKAP